MGRSTLGFTHAPFLPISARAKRVSKNEIKYKAKKAMTAFKWIRIIGIGVCAGLMLCQTAVAADDKKEVYKLDEVVVTSTKSEKSILDAPGSVDVVTYEEFEKRNVKDIDDAVRMVTGVFDKKSKGFADISPTINIRGVSGSNRNLILIDGQPVSEHVWRRFPLELVDRIEVAKGPYSSLYGSDAMGGVVNIITKQPDKKMEVSLNTGYEENNTQTYEMVLSGKADRWTYSASARNRSTDGYESNFVVKSATTLDAEPTSGTEVTGAQATTDKYGKKTYLLGSTGDNYYEDQSYNFKIKRDIGDLSHLQIDYSRTDYEYGYDGDGSYLKDSAGNMVSSGTVYFYNSADSTWEQISGLSETSFNSTYGGNVIDLINVSADTMIGDMSLKGSMSYDKNDYWWVYPSSSSAYVQPSTGEKTRFELSAAKPLPWNQYLTLGADFKITEYEKEQYDLSDWHDEDSRTDKTQEQKGKTRNIGFFLQDEITPWDKLTVYIGGRYDRWSSYDGYNYIIKSGTETAYTFDNRDQDHFSSRASLVYSLSDDSRLKASVGESFRGPTTSELYSGWETVSYSTGERETTLPNEELKPETILSGEFSYEQSFAGRISVKAAYFYNEMNDYIYTKSFSDSEVEAYNLAHYGDADYFSEISQKQNIGKARSQGVEFEVRARLCSFLESFANVTALDTEILENATNPESEGKKIPSIPETTANVGLDLMFKGFSAGIVGRYVGDIYSTDDNSDTADHVFGGYDSYFVVDTKVSYTMEIAGFKPCLSVSLDNIFDEEYYQYYLSPGRTWGVSLNVSKTFF